MLFQDNCISCHGKEKPKAQLIQRLAREMRNPVRLAGRVVRYFTLFAKRA
mgnify:CR=1 FL=1